MRSGSSARPPVELIIASQIVLGAYIGARFSGQSLSFLRNGILLAIGHVLVMLCLSGALAYLLIWSFGLHLLTGLLSFAPGGMSEIGLIALSLGLDVGFIATIHVTRSIVISTLGPIVYTRIKDLLRKPEEGASEA